MNTNKAVQAWVDEMAKLTKPDRIEWIDGSKEQIESLKKEGFRTGDLIELDQEVLPGCVYHRTAVNDVARVEHLTFICTPTKEEAGPTNNWMAPDEAYNRLGKIFDGSMKGRTMYVIPYLLGTYGSPFTKVGIEITDSIYVVLNMLIMTRAGDIALKHLGDSDEFNKGLHGKEKRDLERRYICQFPQDNTIWSVGSGYGGNVLLGKKCFSLRVASYMGRNEGWMAEHMLILGLEDPKGNITYMTGAFPSACGKTNLAMLVPPDSFPGYKVWTVGDDIAWMRIGEDGRLWAMNPEFGFFGVAPGTSMKSNPNALLTMKSNSIYTNVVITPEKTVWWEGMGVEPPKKAWDWKGNEWTPESGEKGAQPNSRFTAPASQCPCISKEWENPKGVPISAIIFGGRRAKVAPLVYQSFDWNHGVFIGSMMGSETTAAATGQVGVVRRDPMAMLPFCGYNMVDYFRHWIKMGKKIPNPPKIFNVNWFRTDEQGKFIWPGYGENVRILDWIARRCSNQVVANETPIGYVPKPEDIDIKGLGISMKDIDRLLELKKEDWEVEIEDQKKFYEKFGDTLPEELNREYTNLKKRFGL
ncbi:MAG: phosphoenolpyruvate carboxykinase (GTP) [Candidatus Coatesbacteria bacterium]|nr:phosphoenolpyruvate carboxykinase (GTP) [Candidatus Coatesbacteria bacterium]